MSGTIMDGGGSGYLASVNSDGELATASTPAAHAVFRTSVTVQTTSGVLVGARTGRRGLWVQNQGANPVFLKFDPSAATAGDWQVAAGSEFRAETFAYEGEIRAISTGGNSAVLALEMA